MDDFIMKPKIDFAFKELMTDEMVRKGFLAAFLKLNPDDIKETSLLNTNLRREHEDDKQGILDVRVALNSDTEIDVEINLTKLDVWANRSLFYLAKMYTEQIKPGDSYVKLKKCVSISILDFRLFENEPDFYSCFHIREDNRHFLYTDKMEFHVIELPKLPEKLKEGDNILAWAKFINAERREEFEMLAGRDKYLEAAYSHLQTISQDENKRMEYEARQRAIRDHNQYMLEAHERDLKEGVEKGRTEGRKEGWTEGVTGIAKKLLAMGLDLDTISKGTGLTVEQIQKL